MIFLAWMMSCRLSSRRSPKAEDDADSGCLTVKVWCEGSGTRYGTGLYGRKGGAEPGGFEIKFKTSASGIVCCSAAGTVLGRGGGHTASTCTCDVGKGWEPGADQRTEHSLGHGALRRAHGVDVQLCSTTASPSSYPPPPLTPPPPPPHLVQQATAVVVHERLLAVGQLVGREQALAHSCPLHMLKHCEQRPRLVVVNDDAVLEGDDLARTLGTQAHLKVWRVCKKCGTV